MSKFLIGVGVCAVFCGAWVLGAAEPAGCASCGSCAKTVEVSLKDEAKAADKAKTPKLPKGFKSLFDGKTLKGWTGRKTLWSVVDGVIVGQTTPETKLKGHNDFLYTDTEYGDFELRLKYKLTNHNSGVQIRSKVQKDFRVTGYQADMAEKRYTGILYGEGIGRGIMADVDAKKMEKIVKKGQWNEWRIVCKGNVIQFWLNGTETIKFTETKAGSPTKGVIAFQLHQGPPMKVEFKDIIIKELPKEK